MRRAPAPSARRSSRLLLPWSKDLSRAEREHLRERLALFALSGVVAVVIVLVGGTLLTENVLRGLQPVAKMDGRTVARLRDYAGVFGYRQNSLLLQYQAASEMARQPAASSDDSQVASFAQQQAQAIQRQLGSLQMQLVEDFVEAELIRREAGKRVIAAAPHEITAELKRQIGYVEPDGTGAAGDPATDAAPAGAQQVTATSASSGTAVAVPGTGRGSRREERGFEPQLRRYLSAVGGSERVARSLAEVAVLRQKLQSALSEDIPTVVEQVRAQHILVPDEMAAQAVLERMNWGDSFEALAAELSTDPGSKDTGGDLGWFPRGVMVEEFEETAFRLAAGNTSEPVKSRFGYHVIRVVERDPQRALGEEMSQSLRANAFTRWLDSAKEEHKIERLIDSWKIEWAQRHASKPRLR